MPFALALEFASVLSALPAGAMRGLWDASGMVMQLGLELIAALARVMALALQSESKA